MNEAAQGNRSNREDATRWRFTRDGAHGLALRDFGACRPIMRCVTVVLTVAVVAAPAARADNRVERIVTRHVQSIVPGDGAGGVAVALRVAHRTLFFNYGWADRASRPADHARHAVQSCVAAQGVRGDAAGTGGAQRRAQARRPRRQIRRRAAARRRHPPRHARSARDPHVGAAAAAGSPALAGLGLHAAGVHPHPQCLEGGEGARSATPLYPRRLYPAAARARAPIRPADRRADRAASAATVGHAVDDAAAARRRSARTPVPRAPNARGARLRRRRRADRRARRSAGLLSLAGDKPDVLLGARHGGLSRRQSRRAADRSVAAGGDQAGAPERLAPSIGATSRRWLGRSSSAASRPSSKSTAGSTMHRPISA